MAEVKEIRGNPRSNLPSKTKRPIVPENTAISVIVGV